MFENAKWISCEENGDSSAKIFKKNFKIGEFKTGELSVCGLGFYVVKVNGKNVTDELLTPPFTAYDKRVLYQTYDVGEYLTVGENEIEITCGQGWYAMRDVDEWRFEHSSWISGPKAICELCLDGKTALVTDSSWLCAASKTIYNSLRYGETYDATKTEFNFTNAIVARAPGGKLLLQQSPSVKLAGLLDGEIIASKTDGDVVTRIYDFGENLTGNAEITVSGKRGDEVRILYGERLADRVNLDRADIDVFARRYNVGRFAEDRYILGGTQNERWHSDFEFHGFRYALVEYPNTTEIVSLVARNFHTELKRTGDYKCSDVRINALHDACIRSTVTNFVHIPTDCPHREKNGWTADAYLSSYQTVYNFDMKGAYLKWLDDVVDTQRPSGQISCIAPTGGWGYEWGSGVTWDAVLFVIPWNLYLFTGDKTVLSRYVEPMKNYLSYLETSIENGLCSIGLGDWCAPSHAPGINDTAMITCFAKKVYDIYADTCGVLGITDEAARAKKRSSEIRKAFYERFVGKHVQAQTYLAALIWFDMVDDKQTVADELATLVKADEGRIIGGIFGAMIIPEVLRDYGYFQLAYEAIVKDGYPSWMKMLSNGSGTLWECWDGSNSLNHHMFSTVDAFIHSSLSGLKPNVKTAGLNVIELKPYFPNGVDDFEASYDLCDGKLVIEWDKNTFKAVIPNGVTASVELKGKIYNLSVGENVLNRE